LDQADQTVDTRSTSAVGWHLATVKLTESLTISGGEIEFGSPHFPNTMKFQVNPHSKYSLVEQLKEQIKLAISLGRIGPGYTLPSIRDAENDLGIGRATIHKAYRDLQELGILTLNPRKGVVVAQKIVLPTTNHRVKRCEVLSESVFRKVEALGVLQSAFAAFLYQRAVQHEQDHPPIAFVSTIRTESEQCADQVSAAWSTKVIAFTVEGFNSLTRSDITFSRVLTPFYEFDHVAPKAHRLRLQIAPVVFKYSSAFVRDLALELDRGKAAILLNAEDFERHGEQLIGDLREKIGAERSRSLVSLPVSRRTDIAKIAASRQYRHVYIGNRIWDSVDANIRNLPNVSHPGVEVDAESLQQAKVKLGLLV
jgi:DNA-binding transcriptional regulator YhcF (GntR family)